MLNRNRRVASVLLAAVVGVTSLSTGSVTVFAEEMWKPYQEYAADSNAEVVIGDEKAAEYGEYDYAVLEDNTVKITKYSGSEKTVVIPSQIDGKSVTSIGRMAFSECSSLTSVTIPEGVTSVETSAFYECSGLTSVTIPKSVMNIGAYAFFGCSSLTNVTIPEGVTSIGNDVFEFCSSLTSITVESANTAFASLDGILYNKDMTELIRCPEGKAGNVTIPEGVTSIDESFLRCSSLTSITVESANTVYASLDGILYNKDMTKLIRCPSGKVGNATIPESVTSIESVAFHGCISLISITVESANTAYASQDGILYNKDMTELIRCPDGKAGNATIPEGVTSIGDFAFTGCISLTSVTIPEGATSIGNSAFSGCISLTSVTILEGVTKIGFYAFSGCSSLTSVTIPESVTFMGIEGDGVFSDCNLDILTVFVIKGSYAESYVKAYGVKYRYIGECLVHNYTSQVTTEPTCTETGIKTYTCIECGNTYTEKIPAAGHTYEITKTKATTKENGSITKKCTVCGAVESKTIIYAAKNITLSKDAFTYTGKPQKPSISIRDSKGKALKLNTDYTLSYPKGIKNVGSYTVTIKFKENYRGTVKKAFTIVPKATSISKISAKSKGFTVKWKKQASQTTGYEIAYSTSSKFTKKTTKTVTVSKNKTVSKSVSKLKAKKKYYVRIRTYKTVKVNGRSTKLYSNWSKAKNVTTKK